VHAIAHALAPLNLSPDILIRTGAALGAVLASAIPTSVTAPAPAPDKRRAQWRRSTAKTRVAKRKRRRLAAAKPAKLQAAAASEPRRSLSPEERGAQDFETAKESLGVVPDGIPAETARTP
jgi:hypothetical protein